MNTGKQQQSEHPQTSHIKRFGEQLERQSLTDMLREAGSADLHKRIIALGSMAIGFGLIGIDPESAVVLALGATVVLAEYKSRVAMSTGGHGHLNLTALTGPVAASNFSYPIAGLAQRAVRKRSLLDNAYCSAPQRPYSAPAMITVFIYS